MIMNFKKPLIFFVIALITAILCNMISLNFIMMFILLLLFMVMPALLRGITGENFTMSFLGSICVLAFGLLTIQVLGNYFNPREKNIFTNNEHHALRVDGLLLKSADNMILCANSHKAFFDNKTYNGSLKVIEIDTSASCVRLKAEHFSHPIYMMRESSETCCGVIGYDLINTESLPLFEAGDTVVFVGRNKQRMSLVIEEQYNGRKRSKAFYHIDLHDGTGFNKLDEKEFDSFLKTGYSLAAIISGVVAPIDLNGVNLVRTSSYPTIKNVDVKEAYKDSLVRYAVEFSANTKVEEVIVNGRSHRPGDGSMIIDIPFDKVFYVGFGSNKSTPVQFTKIDESLVALKYELPKYQYLKTGDDEAESTIMFTSSIVDNSGEIIPDLSENIILYDMFTRTDNIYHMNPSYLSFVKGRSNEDMTFTLYSGTDHKTYTHLHTIDKSEGPGYFPSMSTLGNPSVSWLVSVENFKNTTPFGVRKISWFILIITLCSVILLNMNDSPKLFGDDTFDAGRRYSYVEYAVYLIVIAFMAVRLFLMWRITVFPPVTMITRAEWNCFRDNKMMTILYGCAALFFTAIYLLKKYYSYGLIYNLCDKVYTGVIDLSDNLIMWVENKLDFDYDEEFANQKFPAGITYRLIACIKRGLFRLSWLLPIICCAILATILEVIALKVFAPSGLMLYLTAILLAMPFMAAVVLYVVRTMKDSPTIGRMGTLIGLVYSVVFVLILSFDDRIVNIFIPVIVYFALEFLVTYVFAPDYRQDIDNINSSYASDQSHERQHRIAFSFSVVLLMLTVIPLFKADGGYGTMFLLYAVFAIVVKLLDVDTYWADDSLGRNRMIKLLVALAVVFAIGYKLVLVWLMNDAVSSRLIFFGFLAVLMVSVLWLLTKCFKFALHKPVKIIVPICIALLCIWMYDKSYKVIDGSHMEYRTMVHMKGKNDPTSIMASLTDNKSANKFMQASLNDWILNEYYENGKDVKPVSWGKDDYFKLQPHSKAGALWFAQTTDIVLARYIIAEHSELLAILFMLAYLALFLICSFKVVAARWGKIIIVLVPLLFMVQSVMIWMANTRRFIFFGQDFPLISVTSKFSALFFFVLMLILVVVAFITKDDDDLYEEEADEIAYLNKRWVRRYGATFGIIVLVLVLWGQTNSLYDPEDNKYSMKSLMKDTNNELKKINVHFLEYQEDAAKMGNPVVYSSDMSAVVADFFKKYPRKGLKKFTDRILENYEKSGSKRNSVNDVVHIKKVKYQDLNEKETIRLEFALRLDFYDLDMPEDNGWKGHIVDSSPFVSASARTSVSEDAYNVYTIPGEYVYGQDPVMLIKAKKNNVSVVGDDFPVSLSSDSLSVVKATNDDNVYVSSVLQETLPLKNQEYLARNVMINGQRAFVYPMQSQLYWMRDFSAKVRDAKKKQSSSKSYHGNISTTLDSDLIASINKVYGSLSGNIGDKAVVVADGEGKVRAIADRRADAKYRLNPNDATHIREVIDSLYLEGELERSEGERYFGNYALQTLRRGPGSTQKPLVWTAVTTQYNTGRWADLKLHRLSRKYMTVEGDKFVAPMFNGVAFNKNHQFESPKWDEGYTIDPKENNSVDLFSYMKMSSNYYNAIMVYLGTLTKQNFENGNVYKNVPLIRNKQQYDSLFPIIHDGKKLRAFNLPLTLDNENDQLFYKGFKDNFGLHSTSGAEFVSLYPDLFENEKQQGYLLSDSYIDHASRSYEDAAKYNYIERAIRMTALGAKSSWQVTPIKMAEMYGRMASFNRNYTLSFEPSENKDSTAYEKFKLHETWPADTSYLKTRADLFKGMEAAIKEKGGTAYKLYNEFFPSDVKNCFNGDSGYYIYAKTGTINGTEKGRDVEDHLLAVVITDTDLTKKELTIEDLEKMKFYVIYLVDYSPYGDWRRVDSRIISEVINSRVFKEYMGEN